MELRAYKDYTIFCKYVMEMEEDIPSFMAWPAMPLIGCDFYT